MEEREKENPLFINKYQPFYFDDFEQDNQVIHALKQLIQMDNLNVLLVGEMTTGKTSILKALIREYYDKKNPNLYEENVLYLNSLKEQGINYYRNDVKTFCQTYSSIKGKKKIVVIDDIDFINEQSQQVFRNYIDKYSHCVHFITSCSNIQKVIESIQSRLTIIKIQYLSKKSIINIIQRIKRNEQIVIDHEAEQFIMCISNNNMKVIINYMEKFKLLNMPITYDLVVKLCTNISFIVFEKYTQCLLKGDLTQAIHIINDIYDKGYSIIDILDEYFMFIKYTNVLDDEQKYKVIPFLCKYITIFNNIHEDEIELCLFTNNLIQMLGFEKEK